MPQLRSSDDVDSAGVRSIGVAVSVSVLPARHTTKVAGWPIGRPNSI